jgi:hypothetical protein
MLAAADARPRGTRRQRFRPADPVIHAPCSRCSTA